jgi:glycosyltransferase involved in cell wall biosynthesis
MRPKAFLAAMGDSNSPVTWSGIPYHFLQAARAEGLLDEGLPLATDGAGWKARRIAWNIGRVLSGDRLGGYQYSSAFLERLWSPVTARLRNNVVVNCFQLYPPSIVKDPAIEKWFFLDQTLLQLFDFYGQRSSVGRRIAQSAIEREREGYQSAAGVIVHSRWAARCVIGDYGVAANRVHVVTPGANVDPFEYARWEIEEEKRRSVEAKHAERPLRLVFVGKYWRRKGLDRLLGALRLARRAGSRATLRVIGCERASLPAELLDVDGVEWIGFVDKRADAGKFLHAVSECDIGCLLSRVEAGGIAYREYHALALAVLGTNAGGAPEHMIPETSIVVSTEAADEEVAATLLKLERDSAHLKRLRESAWNLRRNALWQETVRQIQNFWPYLHQGTAPVAQTPGFELPPESIIQESVA